MNIFGKVDPGSTDSQSFVDLPTRTHEIVLNVGKVILLLEKEKPDEISSYLSTMFELKWLIIMTNCSDLENSSWEVFLQMRLLTKMYMKKFKINVVCIHTGMVVSFL